MNREDELLSKRRMIFDEKEEKNSSGKLMEFLSVFKREDQSN
jgi:hypothetical protein